MTLTKPGITALIVLVAVAGYFLARPTSPDLVRLGLLVVSGALASAGAAALNHYLDRDVDAAMRRTRGRPVPEARVSPTGSLVFGLALFAVGVALAAVTLNLLTSASILLGGLTYVVVYTLWLKRRSSWNIVVGGFAGSAPALAGSAAAVGSWTPAVLVLALLVFLWTPPHFWSLALLLRRDYAAAGLPMLPRMDDPGFSGKVVVVSASLLVPPSLGLAATGAVAWPVSAVLVALAVAFVGVTLPLWREPSSKRARRGFLYSGPYLLAVVVVLVLNAWLLSRGVGTGW